MAWCYELRGSDHRLVEVRSGFNTETEARNVGQRVKRKIDCIRYAKPETLTLVTKEHGGTLSRFVGMPSPDKWLDLKRGAKRGVKMDLKYRWQQRVLHAFLESDPKTLLRKIARAEYAISARMLDRTPFERGERTALGELLSVLRKLLGELAEPQKHPTTHTTKKTLPDTALRIPRTP
ncbi:MAG: hypothetical protein DMG32_07670 [Acidobacteria bacterium]|nr:MAG: hypothetical protein DMG32_07670 [Acidobacteriota bacterium]